MGSVKSLTAKLKPSRLLMSMCKHSDVSEGTNYKIVATRVVLGKRVDFYHNGLRKVHGVDLGEQDSHDSELLRFTHASILTGVPSGDKGLLYVDASVNPVEVWLWGVKAEEHLAIAKQAITSGAVDPGFLIEEPLEKTKEFYRG